MQLSSSNKGALHGLSSRFLDLKPHSRFRVLLPPPQVTEQAVQSVQGPNSGHLSSLHFSSTRLSPGQNRGSSLRPPSGKTHSLVFCLFPPPQVTEQAVHSVHSVQTGHSFVLHSCKKLLLKARSNVQNLSVFLPDFAMLFLHNTILALE